MLTWANSEDDIVNYFNNSQAAQEGSQGGSNNITKVMAGLLFTSMEDYTIRLALSTDQTEATTDKLFPASLIRFEKTFQEDQYAVFVILQTIVDQALMWNKAGEEYDIMGMIPRKSLLPTNKEEKCSPKLVNLVVLF